MPTGADLIAAARAYLGVPYLWGGKTSAGLDCSGLVTLAARDLGVRIVDGSKAQIEACTPISLELARRTPGALLWRDGHDSLSCGDGRVIEAIRPVVTEGRWSDTYAGAPRWTKAGLLPGITYDLPEAPVAQAIASPAHGRVTSWYGPRAPLPWHYGIDVASLIAGTPDQPVAALAAGTITKAIAGRPKGAGIGKTVNGIPPLSSITSGNGIELIFHAPITVTIEGRRVTVIGIRYGHLAPLLPGGSEVEAGRVIGTTDLSGGTSGYHVHIEIMTGRGAKDVTDPAAFLRALGITPGVAPDLAPAKPGASKPNPTPAPEVPETPAPVITEDPTMKLISCTTPWGSTAYAALTDSAGAEGLDDMWIQVYGPVYGPIVPVSWDHWNGLVARAWERQGRLVKALGGQVTTTVEEAIERVLAASGAKE